MPPFPNTDTAAAVGDMAKKKYFTAREIDALIPKLEQAFAQIDDCRVRATEMAHQWSQGRDQAPSIDASQAQMIQAQSAFLMTTIEEDVEYIASLGGVVKDLNEGLVDFPTQVHGEPAWLCWRRGETHVRFWHSLDEGFSERQFLQPQNPTTLH